MKQLEDMLGLIQIVEGEKLAEFAGNVPRDTEIVEIGTARGLSTCWLAWGSMQGNGAHITCVDHWPKYEHPGQPNLVDTSILWDQTGEFETFRHNLEAIDAWHLVTPLRGTSKKVARHWVKPIGLLFHDADHSEEGVTEDYFAWGAHLIPGGVFAMHDYYEGIWNRETEVWDQTDKTQKAIENAVIPSGEWSNIEVTASLWSGIRA